MQPALQLIPRNRLSKKQLAYAQDRITDPVHNLDSGPLQVWNSAGYYSNLFAAIEASSAVIVGLVFRAGLPDNVDAAWWVDSICRQRGYGYALIDALGALLLREGTTELAAIRIDTNQGMLEGVSRKLLNRLRLQINRNED